MNAHEQLGAWPPADLALPATVEGIEEGRPEQRWPFAEQPDDSRAARLARLLTVPDKDYNPPGRRL